MRDVLDVQESLHLLLYLERCNQVRTVSRSMAERDVIKVEVMENLKHGSRMHKINDN